MRLLLAVCLRWTFHGGRTLTAWASGPDSELRTLSGPAHLFALVKLGQTEHVILLSQELYPITGTHVRSCYHDDYGMVPVQGHCFSHLFLFCIKDTAFACTLF